MALPELPGISGMVKVAGNQFLVVHDGKRSGEPRLGIIDVTREGPNYRKLSISNWPSLIGREVPHPLGGANRGSALSWFVRAALLLFLRATPGNRDPYARLSGLCPRP